MEVARSWATRTLAICMALAVGVIVFLAGRDGEEKRPEGKQGIAARIVNERELSEIAEKSGHPVYWAGEVDGAVLEASESAGGSVLLRYVEEEEAEAGARAEDFVAVGSYAIPNPRKALRAFAEQPGAMVRGTPELGKIVTSSRTPRSAYFVDPANTVQVEVYDPVPRRALRLILSGKIQPVG